MRSFIKSTVFLLLLFSSGFVPAQSLPRWTRTINAAPDSAYIYPVRTLTDQADNVYVLCTYSKTLPTGPTINKIYLDKYDSNGSLLWNLVYDNGGIGQPRGFDMSMDFSENCLIAGAFMDFNGMKPLLIKVDPNGTLLWQLDTFTAFNTGNLKQVICGLSTLFVQSANGVAEVSLNGVEQWSVAMSAQCIAVDRLDHLIASGSMQGSSSTIFRFDFPGAINFSDSTLLARRITTDSHNNIYLVSDLPGYELVKYDATGNFEWQYANFPPAPPFGDIGFEVITDYDDNIILAGIGDSLFKFDPAGNVFWRRSMDGLDAYKMAISITYSNLIVLAGSLDVSGQYDVGIATYNLNGIRNWSGSYNSNIIQEFTNDLACGSFFYVLEDSISNATLMQFEAPFMSAFDTSLICVDSIWYDTLNPNYINISVFNGSNGQFNYPSVQIISPSGDTISNPDNTVFFFAHIANSYLVYHDTISLLGITDFSNYTFVMSESFGASSFLIGQCLTTGVKFPVNPVLRLFPNPVRDHFYIDGLPPGIDFQAAVFDLNGKLLSVNRLSEGTPLDFAFLPAGFYFLRITGDNQVYFSKFIKG